MYQELPGTARQGWSGSCEFHYTTEKRWAGAGWCLLTGAEGLLQSPKDVWESKPQIIEKLET